MKRNSQIHCLFRSNMGDVNTMPFMSYITNKMRILGHKIVYRKLKINSMSIRTGYVEYIMSQKITSGGIKKCDFHLSTPLEFNCLTRNTKRNAMNILQI